MNYINMHIILSQGVNKSIKITVTTFRTPPLRSFKQHINKNLDYTTFYFFRNMKAECIKSTSDIIFNILNHKTVNQKQLREGIFIFGKANMKECYKVM